MEYLIKTKLDTQYPDDVVKAYSDIVEKLNYRATVSNFIEIVKLVVNDGKDWELFDYNISNNIQFESFLIECITNFKDGKAINFTEIVERLKSYAMFTNREEYTLFENRVEYKIWAIFLVLANININLK